MAKGKKGKGSSHIDFYPMTAGTRFFFFNSLYEKQSPGARRMLNAGKSMVQLNLQTDKNKNEAAFITTIYQGIAFLQEAAEQAEQNEYRLINERILPVFKGTKYESELLSCFSNNNIDYPRYLAILNLLYDDSKITLELTKDMRDAMGEYAKTHKDIINSKQYSTYTDIKAHMGEITQETHEYNDEHNIRDISILTQAISGELSSFSKIREADNEDIKIIMNFFEENFYEILFNPKSKYQNFSTGQKDAFLTTMMTYLTELALLLKKQNAQQKQNIDQAVQELINGFNDLPASQQEEYKEFLGTKMRELLNMGEDLVLKSQQLNKILERQGLEKISFDEKDKTGRVYGLTLSARRALAKKYANSKLDDAKYTQATYTLGKDDKKKYTFNIERKEDNKEYLVALIKTVLKKDIAESEIKTNDILRAINQVNKILKERQTQKEQITIATEHGAAQMVQALTRSVTAAIGGDNLKNDATTITLGEVNLKRQGATDKDITDIQQIIRDVTSSLDSDYTKKYTLRRKIKKQKLKSFNIEDQLAAQNFISQKYINQITQEVQKKQNLILLLKDIFQIDVSVKYSTAFTPITGFEGGSLGGNVETQIENINKMLELGGITPIENEFLITAVLNSGDALIGSNQRSALENYFSTVAALAMFRSGGANIQQLQQQSLSLLHSDSTKIHLYSFNTKLIPESFILRKTYEGLNNCLQLLTSSANSDGSSAKIYNNVNESHIAYKEVKFQNKEPVKIPDWETTASNNFKSVSIDMVLMGGFLDILDKMIKIMEGIVK